MIESKRIQIRRDIAQNWTTNNPVLLYGEVGFDMTANNIKIGDGIKPWNELDYISAKVDLSQYYTKEQVDDLIKRIDIPEVDLSDYYTKKETETKIEEAIESIDIPEAETPGKGNIIIKQGDSTQTFNVNQADDQTIYLGGADKTEWFGTQEEFDALGEYNEETVYHIADLEYKELKNKPFVPRKTSDLVNNIGFTMKRDVKQIVTQREWYGTQEEFDAIENHDPEVIYYVEVPQDTTEYYTKAEVDALLNEIRGLIA